MSTLAYEPEKPHACYPPGGTKFRAMTDWRGTREANVGSLWQCDECSHWWIVKDIGLWPKWRPISTRKARRILKHAPRASRRWPSRHSTAPARWGSPETI
jgi:hypothetical protein